MSFNFINYNFGRTADGASESSKNFDCNPYGWFMLFSIYHTVLAYHLKKNLDGA